MEQNIIDFLTEYFGCFNNLNWIKYSIKEKEKISYSYKTDYIFIVVDIIDENIKIKYYDTKNMQPMLNKDNTEKINMKFLIYNRKRKIFKINERNNRN
jgi:hypothetical protein